MKNTLYIVRDGYTSADGGSGFEIVESLFFSKTDAMKSARASAREGVCLGGSDGLGVTRDVTVTAYVIPSGTVVDDVENFNIYKHEDATVFEAHARLLGNGKHERW